MSVVSVKRAYVMDYLYTNPCVDCGEADPIVLEFDHQRDKQYNIAKLITNNCSLKTLVVEIDKCEVRCANCHRRKTADTYGSYKLETLAELQGRVVPKLAPRRLTVQEVQEIWEKFGAGINYTKLAHEYRVSTTSVRRAVTGKR